MAISVNSPVAVSDTPTVRVVLLINKFESATVSDAVTVFSAITIPVQLGFNLTSSYVVQLGWSQSGYVVPLL